MNVECTHCLNQVELSVAAPPGTTVTKTMIPAVDASGACLVDDCKRYPQNRYEATVTVTLRGETLARATTNLLTEGLMDEADVATLTDGLSEQWTSVVNLLNFIDIEDVQG